jgi:hypothetical protein
MGMVAAAAINLFNHIKYKTPPHSGGVFVARITLPRYTILALRLPPSYPSLFKSLLIIVPWHVILLSALKNNPSFIA